MPEQKTAKDHPAQASSASIEPNECARAENDELRHFVLDPDAERQIIKTQDLYIGPMIGILYFLAFLDRSNLGNAGTAGLQSDLRLHGRQFNDAASVFYASYVLIETPAAVAFRKIGARKMIPTVALAWGLVTLFSGFVQNFAGLLATRLILGACEGSLFPCLNLLLISFYRREEMARRTAMIFGAAAISSAFGGLLAYGILQMDGIGGFAGWRWLYVIEGLMSTIVAIVMYWALPDGPSQAWFLTAEQRILATQRISRSAIFSDAGPFDIREVRKAFTDKMIWISALCQFGADVCLYGFSTFLPTILSGLGYSTLERQYMTIPVYAVGAVSYFFTAYASDRLQIRGLALVIMQMFTVVGYIVLITVNDTKVLYFACFFISIGLYVGPGLNITWLNINTAGQWKRATAVGLQQSLANCSGLLSGQLYVSSNAPRYTTGNVVSLAFICVTEVGYMITYYLYRRANRISMARIGQERDLILTGKKAPPANATERTGDADLRFRYLL